VSTLLNHALEIIFMSQEIHSSHDTSFLTLPLGTGLEQGLGKAAEGLQG
jgi:hypothetical protein